MTRCPQRELISDYVCGQLPEGQRRDVEAHAASCPACAAELNALTRLTTHLRTEPNGCAPDLTESVLNATIRTRPSATRAFAMAASAAILLGGIWWLIQKEPPAAAPLAVATQEPEAAIEVATLPLPAIVEASSPETLLPPLQPVPENPSAMDQAVAWLLESQDPDGGWAMGRTGAAANYTVGLSALALLALLSQPPDTEIESHREAIQRGLSFLLSQQDQEGLFGPDITGSLYNHTLACLALLEGRTDPADGLRAGLSLLIRHQRAEGGWSYLRARSGKPNSGLTTWSLLALIQAEQAGVVDFTNEIARGVAWLETTLDDEGRAGYRRPGDHPHGSETLTAAAALCLGGRTGAPHTRLDQVVRQVLSDAGNAPETLDFYRSFFQATALREAGLSESPEMKQLLSRLQAAQNREGAELGSWASTDPWSKAGGRVYSTALAVLALREL